MRKDPSLFKGPFTLINIYYSLLLADNWMTPSPLVVCSYSDNVYRILMGCSGDKVINGKWLTINEIPDNIR